MATFGGNYVHSSMMSSSKCGCHISTSIEKVSYPPSNGIGELNLSVIFINHFKYRQIVIAFTGSTNPPPRKSSVKESLGCSPIEALIRLDRLTFVNHLHIQSLLLLLLRTPPTNKVRKGGLLILRLDCPATPIRHRVHRDHNLLHTLFP